MYPRLRSLIILELIAMKQKSYVETNMKHLFQLRLVSPLDLMDRTTFKVKIRMC